jgi:hypothetical protein
MPNSRFRLVAVLSPMVLAAGTLSLADTSRADAARGPTCRCFHVTAGPDVPKSRYGALARDRNGGEHVIAARRLHPRSQDYALTYLTRRHGQNHWAHHRVSGIPPLTGFVATFAGLTPSGRHILVVANSCAAETVYVGEASLRARTVHMTAAYAPGRGECGGVLDATYRGVTALARHRIALLVRERSRSHSPAVAIGRVGSRLPPPTALPNPGAVRIEQSAISEDRSTGQLIVIAGSFDDGVFAWTKLAGNSWSMPTMIAPSVGYRVDSVTIANHKVAVGLDNEATGGLYVVERATGANWSVPRRLPHTLGTDGNLILQFDPTSGHLHVAFNRAKPHGAGMFHGARVAGKWLPLTRVTDNRRDEPQEITFTKSERPVIGYQRH